MNIDKSFIEEWSKRTSIDPDFIERYFDQQVKRLSKQYRFKSNQFIADLARRKTWCMVANEKLKNRMKVSREQ